MIVAAFLIVVAPVLALAGFAWWTARRVEAAVPPPGRFIAVAGLRLHYVDQGSGPVVLMIHGLASQLQTFTFALADRLPGYRLIMLDRPGAGYSQAAPAATLAAQADVIAAFLDALGLERALVVGHSLGGALALVLAIRHPDRVSGLALVAPLTQAGIPTPKALQGLAIRSDLVRWVIGWTLAVPGSFRRGPATLAALFGPDPVPRDFGTRGGGFLMLRPWTFRNACRDMMDAGHGYATDAGRVAEIGIPVGVLYGTADRILDYRRHGEGLRRSIPDLDLELIDNGGHMVPLSAPDRTAAFIQRIAHKAAGVREQIG